MNRTILVGRITKDPELRRTPSDIPYVQFTLAVNRRFANKNGERQADFINCIAWRQTAELLARYITKGNQIGVEGQIQTRTYDDQNGVRHYVMEVLCETVTFLESKRQNDDYEPIPPTYRQDNYNNYGYNDNYNDNKKHENPFDDIESDISNDDLPF